MKISDNFSVKELVNDDIVDKLGENRAANIVSPYLLKQLEALRLRFGPITINDYEWGGMFKNSGVRKASFYKRLGIMRESYSTHQYGNTADLKFTDFTAIQVYDYIMDNQDEFPYIVRMENAHKTKTWLHVECGRYCLDNIEVFNP